MISQIIHQLAPTDTSKWHPLWSKCQQSWLKHFNNFEYKLWNNEDIDNLIQKQYPQYYQTYSEFPIHIMKIDFARLAILRLYGGIYADMDVFCYKNFYHELTEADCYVVENPYGNDPIENSLMASRPNHDFWTQCMNLSTERFKEIKQKNSKLIDYITMISTNETLSPIFRPALIFHITGTNLISTVFRKNTHCIGTLSGHVYNNNDMSYHPEYRTKHIHTGLWGDEDIKNIDKNKKEHKHVKKNLTDEFDFYVDYTNGNYLKNRKFDLYKNSYETIFQSKFKYI